MEEFEKIDWLPKIDDMIDEKFVDETRLKKESAMYQIMNGTFHDPFQDIRPPGPINNQDNETKSVIKKSMSVNVAAGKKNNAKAPRKRTKKKKPS